MAPQKKSIKAYSLLANQDGSAAKSICAMSLASLALSADDHPLMPTM
jgi:hypothetical protein